MRTPLFSFCLLFAVAAQAMALDFTPCPNHPNFDCASLQVPLDRSNTTAGTVALHIERLRQKEPSKGIMIFLAGGPGQSASEFAEDIADSYKSIADLYQLVVFDQRGTGESGQLQCRILKQNTVMKARVCANSLGAKADFYTTADSVYDLEAVRTALGGKRLLLLGVSYGTWVGMEYLRAYPGNLDGLVLDSPLPPDGGLALEAPSLQAIRSVLVNLCRNGACAGFTQNVIDDLHAVLERIRLAPIAGKVVKKNGRLASANINLGKLTDIIFEGDFAYGLRALLPPALKAAREGDFAPLLRLNEWVALLNPNQQQTQDADYPLFIATTCTDLQFPWSSSDRLGRRRLDLNRLLQTVALDEIAPFNRNELLTLSESSGCLSWPNTSLERGRIGGKLPRGVPTLVLQGLDDVRTPPWDTQKIAEQLPDYTVAVTVPNVGHSVESRVPCARDAIGRLANNQAINPDICADVKADFPIPGKPPRQLNQVRVPAGFPAGAIGQVLAATVETVRDALMANSTLRSKPNRFGGLRSGHAEEVLDGTNHSVALVLSDYALVPGVKLEGRIELPVKPTAVAALTVQSQAVGKGTVVLSKDQRLNAVFGQRVYDLPVENLAAYSKTVKAPIRFR